MNWDLMQRQLKWARLLSCEVWLPWHLSQTARSVDQRERPTPDIYPTSRRRATASPKRTLQQLRSILIRSMATMRDKPTFEFPPALTQYLRTSAARMTLRCGQLPKIRHSRAVLVVPS